MISMEHLDLKNAIISILSGGLTIFLLFLKSRIFNYYNTIFNKQPDKDPVVEALNISKLIRDTLKRLMQDWKANRAIIVQFHNGGHFYTGAAMQKLSTPYEEQSPGVFPIHRILQNVPITTCMYIKDIIEGNHLVSDVEDIKDIITKTFYTEFGVKSAIGVPIHQGNKVIGAVILHYTECKNKFKPSDINLLAEQCVNLHSLIVP